MPHRAADEELPEPQGTNGFENLILPGSWKHDLILRYVFAAVHYGSLYGQLIAIYISCTLLGFHLHSNHYACLSSPT